MDTEQLERLEKWHMMMGLHGFDIDTMDDEWDNDDCFIETLRQVEEFNTLVKESPPSYRMAIQTVEMGLDMDSLFNYRDYLAELAEKEAAYQRQLRIDSTPLIKNLVDNHQFRFVDPPKRMRFHTCFKFKMTNGIEVYGRIFLREWRRNRLWVEWRDATNKKHKEKWDIHGIQVIYPKGAPEDWIVEGDGTIDLRRTAYIMAHRIVKNTLPTDAKHLMPKL